MKVLLLAASVSATGCDLTVRAHQSPAEDAEAWSSRGQQRAAKRDFEGAAAAYQRALSLRPASHGAAKVKDATRLMLAFANRIDHRRAARAAARAYALASQTSDDDARAYAFLNIAALMVEMGDPETAMTLLEEAEGAVPNDHIRRGYLLQLYGLVEHARGNLSTAKALLAQARTRAMADRQDTLHWNVGLNAIDVAIEMGDTAGAEALLAGLALPAEHSESDVAAWAYARARVALRTGRRREALELAERAVVAAPAAWRPLLEGIRAQAAHGLGDEAAAEEALRHAVLELEAGRAALDNDSFKGWLLAQRREAYEDLFLLFARQNRPADALAVVQLATARAMLDGLIARGRPGASSAHPDVGAAGEYVVGLRRLARVLRDSPAASPPGVDELMRAVRALHLVSYFRARGALWLIVSRPGEQPALLNLGQTELLVGELSAWRRNLDDVGLAERVARRLLPPEALPERGVPLFIAPDPVVAEVSFAALPIEGQFLVDRNPLAYAPSASVLAHMGMSQSMLRQPVLLGDPTADLPAARAAALAAAAQFGVSARVGDAVTRAEIVSASGASLLHLAMHTDAHPSGFALRCADGPLSNADILELRVAARVVLLSSCSTASGSARGELTSVASAFVAAGAYAVVASRWSVHDAAAARFVAHFYAAGGAFQPVLATAAAQRALIQEKMPVASWATFVVIGGAATP